MFYLFILVLVLKENYFNFFFCSFVLGKLSIIPAQIILFYFFIINILFYFIFKVSRNLLKKNFLLLKIFFLLRVKLSFGEVFRLGRQLYLYFYLNFSSFFISFFKNFTKNSKKEFNSEKINTFLLKKKKKMNFF